MKKDLESNDGKYRPIIPLTSPLNLSNVQQNLVIPSYTMGVLLGDGSLSSGVSFTTMDEEILEKVKAEGGKIGSIYNNGSKANSYNLLGISKEVRELGLYGTTSETKFIPQKYVNSSVSDRWNLIQGLFDTDGYVTKDGKTYYDTVSKELAKDIEYVLRSLGFTVTTTSKTGSYTDKIGEKIICKKVYRLYVRGINQKLLFSISRKKERCKVKDVGNGVRNIELICKDFATCISISGNDKLFITDNFVVTHNSAMCLTKNLDAIHDPNFRCTIFRRTYPELKRQGALIDESKKIYSHFGAVFKSQANRWDFPSGAQISFSAIADDGDLGGWQGSQLVRVLIDEAGDKWKENQVLFLLSRMRSAHSSIHPQLIMTANPDSASFLKKWVDFCLDENGIPKPGTENIIRWFVVLESVVCWADSVEELYEKYGKERGLINAIGMSDEEVKKIHPSLLFLPKSFRFIPTNVFDNPYLLPPRNNTYLANLLSQPRVNQLKYLHGSWTAKAEGEGYFKREWVKIVDAPPRNAVKIVRAWDLAATEESEANRDPDWTVGVKMSRDKYGQYYIEDVARFRKSTGFVLEEIAKIAKHDGIDDVEVGIPRDSGAGGKAANLYFVRTLSEQGITVKSSQISGHSGKLNRFLPFASLAEAGSISVVRADWNEVFFTELENFIPNNRNQKDDIVDATADAFNAISKSIQVPTFVLPDTSRQSITAQLNS